MRRIAGATLAFLSSQALACVLLVFLLLLTFIGTIEQVERGLYAVQKEYFGSLFLVHHFFGFLPIPLPGVRLLLALLFLNLVCGGLIKMRGGLHHLGVFVAHFGVVLLLLGSFAKYYGGVTGYVQLFEGDVASSFTAYSEWEVAIAPCGAGTVDEYVIPESALARAQGEATAAFRAEGMPFDVTLSHYARHARPVLDDSPGAYPVVEGFSLLPLEPSTVPEEHVPGVYVELHGKQLVEAQSSILWGQARFPWVVAVDGVPWRIVLRRREWPLPFSVRLDEFRAEFHPGTSKPRAFVSRVTRTEDGSAEEIEISMNKPMRRGGYSFYQSSWGRGPRRDGGGEGEYSVLAVSKDPAERVPFYASIVIVAGLLLHFARRLVVYLRAQQRGRG